MKFCKGRFAHSPKKNREARLALDSITNNYPGHARGWNFIASWWSSNAEGNIDSAIEFYNRVVDLHFDDIAGDDALYNLAFIYDEILRDYDMAEKIYSKYFLSLVVHYTPYKRH